MTQNGEATTPLPAEPSFKILITQPRPDEKSPYFELARKYSVGFDFVPFIRVEGIPAREFRRQKIDIVSYTAVIFTSRNAIDHFFRMCEEMRISISQDAKYFCITEAVALYLQKFILYRKRKVFYGADGTNKSLFDVMNKHRENERFLYVCSENQQDNEIVNWLKNHKCEFATPFMYRTISADIKELLKNTKFNVICFFTPSAVKSLFENVPKYKPNGTAIGAFGNNTAKALEEKNVPVQILAPQPQTPSMAGALEKYIREKVKTP
jgi:uroporphyrinogen-III synthase